MIGSYNNGRINRFKRAALSVCVLSVLPQLHEEYRKLSLARQKKKPNLKRERESVRKVLKEWWAVYQSLDESYNQ